MLSGMILFFSLLLILCGLFFILYLLTSKLCVFDDEGWFVAVEGYEETADLEEKVYSAFIQANMMNFGEKRAVYVFDRNLTDGRKNSLKSAVEPYGKVVFIKSNFEET